MEEVVIETPEQIEFSYELAGLGSRFLASLYDHLLQFATIAVTYLALFLAYKNLSFAAGLLEKTSQTTIMGFLMILAFLLYFGYFPFFETIWNGQTPGKRIVGIRVIKSGGYPLSFNDIFLRNLLRLVDVLPWSYLIGIVLIFFDFKHRRLGDMIAQTLVIKERQEECPKVVSAVSVSLGDGFNVSVVQGITEKMYNLVRDFLVRRERLDYVNRIIIAKKLALPILDVMHEKEKEGMDYEEFLEGVARHYREWKRV